MPVDSLYGKFLYHLEEMYYIENQLLDVLDTMMTDVTNDELREGLREHREETKSHVTRLEEVFETLEEQPEERECPSFDALIEERNRFLEQATGGEDLRDVTNLGAAAKNEHLEIAGYENLLMLARKLDLSRDVRDLLEDNLDEEQQTKKQLKAMADDSAVRSVFARLVG